MCGTLATNTITITVTTEVLVGTIGMDQAICYAAAPALLTTITGPSAGVVVNSQNWMKSEDAVEWSDISTATSDTYQSGVLNNTMYFRKKMVTAGNGTIYTNIITITVNPAFDPGTIGSDQSVCKTFAAAPITTTVLPTGQSIQNLWQISDNNASWTDITGSTNDYYDAGVLTVSKFFRKKVTSACGTGYTNSVKITVNDELQGGTIGNDQSITYNTSPSALTGTLPTGGTGTFTYQWYYSVNNIDWQIVISGGDGKDYQPGVLSQKTYFKRKVTDGSCGEKYSNILTITVFDSILPGVVSEAQSICYNTVPALLSGTSPGGGTGQYSYQWQYSLQGVTWIDIASEVGISYRPDALKVNTYYRRAVTSGNSTVYSNFVMIKVFDQISLPTTDLKTSYCKGSTVNINVVNPAYLSYKWFDSGHAYLMDGTKYTLSDITTGNTVYVKSLDLNGCLSDYLEQKISIDIVKADFTQDITTVTLGDAIKFTNTSVNASSYSWNFFEGDIITEHSPVHYYNTLGVNSKKFSVQLTIKSEGGCSDSVLKDEIITVVNPVTGIEKNKEITFSCYPNPVSEILSLTSNERIKTVKIFNISGKIIESLIFDSEAVAIDFSSLKSDIYILEINGFRNSKKNIKIIKK
ncbi:MAG: T9SS type A sorting domain-containing protein [Bacteroidales bacterium]|nr:T9SS type A sorting domain-containing protein [Bacteroidales bacterium]